MISTAPQRKYEPGTRLRVVQHVRVGSQRWTTEVFGVVTGEGLRGVGGIEMGTKAAANAQEILGLRGDDGELTTIVVDENTEVHVV